MRSVLICSLLVIVPATAQDDALVTRAEALEQAEELVTFDVAFPQSLSADHRYVAWVERTGLAVYDLQELRPLEVPSLQGEVRSCVFGDGVLFVGTEQGTILELSLPDLAVAGERSVDGVVDGLSCGSGLLAWRDAKARKGGVIELESGELRLALERISTSRSMTRRRPRIELLSDDTVLYCRFNYPAAAKPIIQRLGEEEPLAILPSNQGYDRDSYVAFGDTVYYVEGEDICSLSLRDGASTRLRPLSTGDGAPHRLINLRLSPDGRWLIEGDIHAQGIGVHELGEDGESSLLQAPYGHVPVGFDNVESILFTCNFALRDEFQAWSLESGELLCTFEAFANASVLSVTVTGDGSRLLVYWSRREPGTAKTLKHMTVLQVR